MDKILIFRVFQTKSTNVLPYLVSNKNSKNIHTYFGMRVGQAVGQVCKTFSAHCRDEEKIKCDEQLSSIEEQQYRMQRSQNAYNAQNVVSASGVDIEIKKNL